MRLEADPKADKAAEALLCETDGYAKEQVGAYISRFVSHDFTKPWVNDTPIPDPPELLAYFNDLSDFDFTQAELAHLDAASAFFEKHGPWVTFALGVRSLLKQYAHTKAIEVLRVTTLLEKHVNRRIMETMQFVLDVMQPGWTTKSADGTLKLNLAHPGVMSIKKLRLVHAMVRFRIHFGMYDRERLGVYDIDRCGQPINQEDMVFAIHTFSLEIIEGLREMRVPVTEAEIQDYFHAWRIIGRALGVDPRLEPVDYADAMALQDKIYARHFTLPNAHGPVLARALNDWFVATVPLLEEKTLITVIKTVNGPENFDILSRHLGIDIGNAHEDLTAHLEADHRYDVSTARAHLDGRPDLRPLDSFFLQFVEALISAERGGKREPFRIGDGFGAAWNLNQMAEKPKSKLDTFLLAIRLLIEKVMGWFGKRKQQTESGKPA
jgi:hypothetical protein